LDLGNDGLGGELDEGLEVGLDYTLSASIGTGLAGLLEGVDLARRCT